MRSKCISVSFFFLNRPLRTRAHLSHKVVSSADEMQNFLYEITMAESVSCPIRWMNSVLASLASQG